MIDRRLKPVELSIRQRSSQFDRKLSQLDARVSPAATEARALATAWDRHLPDFMNAVASVRSFGWQLVKTQQDLATGLARSDERHAAVEAGIARRDEAQAGLSRRLDGLEAGDGAKDAMQWATLEQVQRVESSISGIWERIEFVRRETLFELAYGRSAADRPAPRPPRIIDAQKLADAKVSGIRLNLGCGQIPLDGYINVDARDLPKVDVIADVGSLPFESGSVELITSQHLLEHFPQEKLVRQLLPYWHGLLKPGGRFRATTPDASMMLAEAAAGRYEFADFREVLFGAQDYAGDFHYNLFTPESLTALLQAAGFVDIDVPVTGRRNGKCFEFEIVATRGDNDLTVAR